MPTAPPAVELLASPASERPGPSTPSPIPAHLEDTDSLAPPSSAGGRPAESIAKPLLASEALMEDLAPVEPGRRLARMWCAAVGVGFVVFGALPLVHMRPGGAGASLTSFVIGAIALVAALARVSYRQRAVAMVVLGLLSGALGLHAPGEAIGISTWWNLVRMVAAIALPGALLFRAYYRAYGGARLFLGAALLAALPFTVHAVADLVHSNFGLAQAGEALAVTAILASLAGFMGSETTGAGTYMAPVVVLVFTGELTLQAVAAGGAFASLPAIVELVSSALAFTGASALASLGLFKILAWRFAADARRIDLHAPSSEPEPVSETDGGSDWSTRE